MKSHWVQMAVADKGLLASIFLSACSDLANRRAIAHYSALSLCYRIECITSLNQALCQEETAVSDLTIAKTLALAIEAVRSFQHPTT